MKIKFKFNHGDELQDFITGFKGICTGTASYITGCNQYLIVARSKDNKESEHIWVDEGRLSTIRKKVFEKIETEKDGADYQAPTK